MNAKHNSQSNQEVEWEREKHITEIWLITHDPCEEVERKI